MLAMHATPEKPNFADQIDNAAYYLQFGQLDCE